MKIKSNLYAKHVFICKIFHRSSDVTQSSDEVSVICRRLNSENCDTLTAYYKGKCNKVDSVTHMIGSMGSIDRFLWPQHRRYSAIGEKSYTDHLKFNGIYNQKKKKQNIGYLSDHSKENKHHDQPSEFHVEQWKFFGTIRFKGDWKLARRALLTNCGTKKYFSKTTSMGVYHSDRSSVCKR